MDFTLGKEHEMARTLFHDFAEKEVKPLAQEVDEEERFPVETVEKMAKNGFLGIPVPKEYGGQGCDPLTYAMCVEELSKVCGTTGVIVSAHTSLCMDPIMTFGTEEQKQKFLVPLAKGEKLGAFGLTEPGAGTDAQGQQTKAVLDGDEWVLNGSKCFITNGKYADTYIVIAVTGTVEKRGKMQKEISAFIVEKGTPGFTFGTKEKKMGIRGSATYELIFTDCRIPKDNLLGKKGEGFKIAMHTLDGGRIGIAAQALGLAEGALDRTVAYVKERKQFGRTIGQFQNTQFQLADMATKVKAAQMMVYRAAMAKATQKSYGVEAAMAKLYAAEVAMEVTTKAVQLHGGYGYIREYDVERMMRDAKITEIYEGTSEVQRMVISGALVKQVPDTKGGVKFKPDGTLDRAAMLTIMNPDDKAGLEAALRLKDQYGAEVTVVTMGLPKAEEVLREAMAMGADNGILVTDRVLGGADTWATSQTIAGALRNLDYDLIITGRQAIDGDTAQVGPQISEHLGLPVISYADGIEIDGNSVIVKRQFDDRYMMLKAKMPCLITALSELNEPRYMTPGGIFDAYKKEITVWGRKDLKDVLDSNLGLKGSPTQIAKASDKVRKGAGVKETNLDPSAAANYIVEKLTEKHVL